MIRFARMVVPIARGGKSSSGSGKPGLVPNPLHSRVFTEKEHAELPCGGWHRRQTTPVLWGRGTQHYDSPQSIRATGR